MNRFGVTPADYLRMFRAQNGLCGICHKPEVVVRQGKLLPLAIDHDHHTGQVRGLLCHRCNTGLGKFKDDKVLLMAAVRWVSLAEDTEEDEADAE